MQCLSSNHTNCHFSCKRSERAAAATFTVSRQTNFQSGNLLVFFKLSQDKSCSGGRNSVMINDQCGLCVCKYYSQQWLKYEIDPSTLAMLLFLLMWRVRRRHAVSYEENILIINIDFVHQISCSRTDKYLDIFWHY